MQSARSLKLSAIKACWKGDHVLKEKVLSVKKGKSCFSGAGERRD